MIKWILALGVIALFGVVPAYAAEYLPILDKSTYSIGDWAVVTLQDSSKNVLLDSVESITITLRSNSDFDGNKIVLVETGPNTGIFSGSIQLSSSASLDTLYVKEGDSIHAMYLSYVQTAKVQSGSNSSPILISTDKDDYKIGEVIGISGSVSGGDTSYDVMLSVVDPHGTIIYDEVIDLSYIRSFSTEINTENTGWTDSGNYKILAWHESENTFAETVFSFSSTYGKQETSDSIKIISSEIELDYTITSGKITLVRGDLEDHSLVISIDVPSGGHLTVEIPRYLMDAQDEDVDIDFVVLMDDRNAAFVEKKNPNERILTVPYIHNTRTIEIVGTSLLLNPTSPDSSTIIPEWVRNNAEWWSKDLIDEGDFVSGIEYLIVQGVIHIPIIPGEEVSEATSVPLWVKNAAGWWSEGLVSDGEFVNGLQYLIQQGIISI